MKSHEFNFNSSFAEVYSHLGMSLMAACAVIGVVEFDIANPVKKWAVVFQPAYAQMQNDQNAIRRERDESGPHYISYGVAQRIPGRSGRA